MQLVALSGLKPSSTIVVRLRSVAGRRYPPHRHLPIHSRRSLHQSVTSRYPRSSPRSAGVSNHGIRSHRAQDVERSESQPIFTPNTNSQEIEANQYPDDVVNVEALGGSGSEGGGDGTPAAGSSNASGGGQNGNGSGKGRSSGGASRKGQASRKVDGIAPFVIPVSFLNKNVRLYHEEPSKDEIPLVVVPDLSSTYNDEKIFDRKPKSWHKSDQNDAGTFIPAEPPADETKDTEALSTDQKRDAIKRSVSSSTGSKHYEFSMAVWREIATSMNAGLLPSKVQGVGSFITDKVHLRLHCPYDGSMSYMERAVETAARSLEADIITLDSQDIAAFAYDYIQEGPEAHSNALWTLGYDVQQVSKNQRAGVVEEDFGDGEEEESEDLDRDSAPRMGGNIPGLHAIPLGTVKIGSGGLGKAIQRIQEQFSRGFGTQGSSSQGTLVPFGNGMSNEERWSDLKLNYMLSSLLEANNIKASNQPASAAAQSTEEVETATVGKSDTSDPKVADSSDANKPRKTIILIRDVKELAMAGKGPTVLEKITDKVKERRRNGEQIMIVGMTATPELLPPEMNVDQIREVQEEWPNSVGRTILVPPLRLNYTTNLFASDLKRRHLEMNIRNFVETVQRLGGPVNPDASEMIAAVKDFPMNNEAPGLLKPLSFAEIHRWAVSALGAWDLQQESGESQLDFSDAITSFTMLNMSDEQKAKWLVKMRGPRALSGDKGDSSKRSKKSDAAQKSETEARRNRLRKECNRYEKRLLNGVVDPSELRTTFDQVHAPKETIESLKTLTMLSLSRPDAFKYGVLATDKISGLLLYGPPGTGKTLLAKAVAKQSGATVLEVTGGDLYNMFVGEGEKNVKAVFSLAKKLSPCVVFIDEADAIFASRGGHNRNSHRELINQFLREWDGLSETNAFIMVATNRPFDLDDAVLRRLPRRLLVDLPVEKDREAILKIHLKDELLDDSVSIDKLASQTNLYSGSDLKNLAVAAALSAVKEETEAGERHAEAQRDAAEGEGAGDAAPYQYPERRVLQQKHFDQALSEISASINEDMSSLAAIKKFDERFGDRKGRKKKAAFGYGAGFEKAKDTVKVRE